jgi:hypothetical protein
VTSVQGHPQAPPAGQPAANVRSSDPRDQARVEQALHVLDGTAHGAEVAEALRRDRTPIQVVPDERFRREHPGAGGIYLPRRHTMYLPASALDQPVRLAILLAHEGTHHIDDTRDGPSTLGALVDMGAAVGDAVTAALHGSDPMTGWLDGIDAREHETEVNAYTRQAQVAAELGVSEYPWDLGENRDGSVASRDEIAGRVQQLPLYRRSPGQRALLGGAGVALAATTTGFATATLAGRLAPSSFLARHEWPVVAGVAALGGGLLLADLLGYEQDPAPREARLTL